MNKSSSVIQYGTPDAAPLLKIQGLGPRIDVPGYGNLSHVSSIRTVKPQQVEKKSDKSGVGHLLDVTA